MKRSSRDVPRWPAAPPRLTGIRLEDGTSRASGACPAAKIPAIVAVVRTTRAARLNRAAEMVAGMVPPVPALLPCW